jgi:hypothetical protein
MMDAALKGALGTARAAELMTPEGARGEQAPSPE